MNNQTQTTGLEIAIIGMAGRFPGAKNVEQFWRNLRDGVESISTFSEEELLAAGVNPALLNNPDYVRAGGVLEDADMFDAAFFGFSPREAEITDPQHRLFLECAWEALEDAGYDSEQFGGSIGIYAGGGMNTYLINNLYRQQNLLELEDGFQMIIGNDKDFLVTRTSYKLNLEGPGVVVQTACSTSLVAVHMASQGLLSGECDMALAGGVSVIFPQQAGYLYRQGSIHSPDGHCRAFDAEANGTVVGNGVGLVVLKRLPDALAAGDNIYAVIKGSAINNDGSLKVSYTAPRVDGQAKAIRAAQLLAEVEPESIGYIEAHGTGTTLGDPIEIEALTQAFRAGTDRKSFCAIGSVKTNIGHLNSAAGVAGLIKAVLALKHRQIPPSLHYRRPNPRIDFASSPFYVNSRLSPWPSDDSHPRRAGVSSFGIGGTNAHLILEEAPEAQPSGSSRPWQVLALSARTPAALERQSQNLAAYLKQHSDLNLADAAYTLQAGRHHFNYRRFVLCRDINEAINGLETGPSRASSVPAEANGRPVFFMFPGQGAQYTGMAAQLYQTEAVFRTELDRCAELLKPHLGLDLRSILYPAPGQEDSARAQLNETRLTQPVLFALEYALAKMWLAWGVKPQAMIGHSLGEYVAACLAGVFELEDALALVASRGRLIQGLPGGAMLVIPLPAGEVEALLGSELSLAAVNGPALCVVSGPVEAVEKLETSLEAQGHQVRRLHVSHAFHSAMLNPILDEFTRKVRQVALKSPKIPYISNVTGNWITAAEATDPVYWSRQLRQAVRFAEGLGELLHTPDAILLEVGPGETLNTFARQQKSSKQLCLATLRHPHDSRPDQAYLLNTLGQLWQAGVKVNWSAYYAPETRQRLSLPTYPFERRRYWVEPPHREILVTTGQSSTVQPNVPVLYARPEETVEFVAPRDGLEQAIADIWKNLLGLEQVGAEDNFFDLGGHSLLAGRLVNQLRQEFNCEVPVRLLFEAPTVAEQAQAIASLRHNGTTLPARPELDLEKEALLDPAIVPENQKQSMDLPNEPRKIFLTGATGFLGAFLLNELLRQTAAEIYCLSRAETVTEAFRKIQANLQGYLLWDDSFASRVIPVLGDLARPNLGMTEASFDELAGQIDSIYHAGAWVNFIYPYEVLKPVNVLGTQEILRLACRGQVKPLHFMSTTAIYTSPGYARQGLIKEDEPLAHSAGLHTGYGQSKWVAEKLVSEARQRGLPVTIYRPATVGGHSQSGAFNASDFVFRMLKACIEFGSAPDLDMEVYLAPADYVSRAIVWLSLQPASPGKAFNLIPPEPVTLNHLLELARDYGYPIEKSSAADWRLKLEELAKDTRESNLSPFISMILQSTEVYSPRLDSRNTRTALAGTPLVFPEINQDLFNVYLDYFKQSGFLPAPHVEVII
ncbi:MAG TPA: thioester reductase domain-containing protein [Chloroflexia bacterium]|nr:thioester reductase domain-containing protein [Chloroflexia bacterium]